MVGLAAAVDVVTYEKARNQVGFFDMSETAGRLIARGKDALDLIHRMSTNDLLPLVGNPGSGAQTVLTSEKGRIIDVLNILSREDFALIVTSRGQEQRVIQWLDKFTIMEDAKFIHATESWNQFAIIGPRSFDLVKRIACSEDVTKPTLTNFAATIGGFPVIVQKYFRLAESGWLVFAEQPVANEVKAFLEATILEMDGAVLDEQTYDIIRIEAGMPQAPMELNEKRNPLETTLVSAVSFTKGCYIGQEVIARLDSYDKVQRHMLGVMVDGLAVEVEADIHEAAIVKRATDPAVHPTFMLETSEGESVGELTSYGVSPGVGKFIGLAFVRTAHANPNGKLFLKLSAERLLPVTLVKLPFDV